MLIATVVGVGVWMVIDYSRRPGMETQAVAQTSGTEPEPAASPESPSPSPSPTAEPSPSREPDPEPKKKPPRLITAGVTIQVLNGTSDPAAGEAMATRLTELGFHVVTVETTSTPYKETTVFWAVPQAEKAAEALAAKFDWRWDEKPGNLADTVSLHVVVGKDELETP